MKQGIPDYQKTLAEEHKWETEKARKNLVKMKKIEKSRNMYSFRFKNGTIISASSPERLEEIKTTLIKQNKWN